MQRVMGMCWPCNLSSFGTLQGNEQAQNHAVYSIFQVAALPVWLAPKRIELHAIPCTKKYEGSMWDVCWCVLLRK
eukprot:scaffold185386_cov15-Tisochrysis_lutea.AAC.2